MAEPGDYFTNPNEKLLATAVWEIAGKPANDPSWKNLHPMHTAFAFVSNAVPVTTRRVLLARDWITNAREQMDWQTGKDDGGVRFINDFFRERFKRDTDFTAKQIANVEHFYVSALHGDIFGPLVGIPVAATTIWEFGVGPIRIHLQESEREEKGQPYRSRVVIQNIKDNARQFKGPDMAGINFGLSKGAQNTSTGDLDRIVAAELDGRIGAPPTHPSPMGVTITYRRKVRKGDTLSLLAKKIYGDPMKWPLIWMRNRGKALSSNYNVLPVGIWIEIPLPASITPAQLDESRRVAANWRPGLTWR